MAQIYQYRRNELTEEETRQAFAPRHRQEWDPQWGGRCPYKNIPDPDPGYKDRSKPSLIDRVVPYILIVGGLGFLLLIGGMCEWLIDYLAGAR